jgi:hypothetical protein
LCKENDLGLWTVEDDAIGYIRAHSRTGASAQRSALNKDGCRVIIEEGKPAQNRDALELLVREGTQIKLYSLWLLADPITRRRPGGWRKDLLAAIGRIRKRGGIIKDVSLQLQSAEPEQFSAMLTYALEKLANNGRTVHLQKLRQGRHELAFPVEIERKVELLWRNVRDYPREQDVAKAIKAIAKKYTTFRARRKYGPRKKRKN